MNKKNLLLTTALFICLSGQAQHTIKLSELDLSHIWQEYGKVQNGKSVTGEQAAVNGKIYNEVIGTHAKKHTENRPPWGCYTPALPNRRCRQQSRYFGQEPGRPSISKRNKNFISARKAMTSNSWDWPAPVAKIDKGSVCFIVKGDGKELYNSGILHGNESPLSMDIDLKGIRILELSVEPTDDFGVAVTMHCGLPQPLNINRPNPKPSMRDTQEKAGNDDRHFPQTGR